MRQTLYRGKKIDNGVWTYGFYFVQNRKIIFKNFLANVTNG